jgi:hypothetical protein
LAIFSFQNAATFIDSGLYPKWMTISLQESCAMKDALQRLIFLLLSTSVMVFFSEKTYWYAQGYVIVDLVFYYAFTVFVCFWAIDHFRVNRPSSIIMVAALYGFLVEGVLTPAMYEAGLLDPVMPAYFVGWHGLISVVFGWYSLRKWLVTGRWVKVLAGGVLFGLFWGVWSLTFWLPESIAELEQLAAQGEHFLPGIWSVREFALHALTFALMLVMAHWLLGRGFWQRSFRPSKIEIGLVLLGLAVHFGFTTLLTLPWAVFKLAAILGVVLLGLRWNRRREGDESLFAALTGTVKFSHSLALMVMPLMASLVYAFAMKIEPSQDILWFILEVIPISQVLIGGAIFLWALFSIWWPRKKLEMVETI